MANLQYLIFVAAVVASIWSLIDTFASNSNPGAEA